MQKAVSSVRARRTDLRPADGLGFGPVAGRLPDFPCGTTTVRIVPRSCGEGAAGAGPVR